MTTQPSLDEAINFLKKYVKYSEVKNQKHLDLTLGSAKERLTAEKALMTTRIAVLKGEMTEEILKEKLGLN